MVNGLHIESGWTDQERKEGIMNATLTTGEFNDFCEKVDILESKGYTLPFSVTRENETKMFNVSIKGVHNLEELDRLCDGTD